MPLNARPYSDSPRRFWILGAGHFGQIAVQRIIRHIHDASITVVDKKPPPIDSSADIRIVKGDGIAWLKAKLDQDAPVDMIVPAIPVHMMAQWLKIELANVYKIHPVMIPDAWLSRMPNAMRGKTGPIFVSHANFTCPDNCPEPENICTHTGEPRPMALYRLLENIDFPDFVPLVIRSYQLLPGVGAVYPADLMNALDFVCENSNRPIMIGTACRCHGVVDFIRLVPKSNHATRPLR
ncbi:MAG: potassium transporter [Desulfobacteraceae bacterium]|nr:MAG: potassium transporter [Desulfobacteraceae bacterium]